MKSPQPRVGGPWYLYFWPWFILSLLGISVLGSLATVFIAYQHRDRDVRELLSEGTAPVAGPDARDADVESATGSPDARVPGEPG